MQFHMHHSNKPKIFFLHQMQLFVKKSSGRYDRAAAAAAKLIQSCPTLCDPIDSSPTDSSVPGFL